MIFFFFVGRTKDIQLFQFDLMKTLLVGEIGVYMTVVRAYPWVCIQGSLPVRLLVLGWACDIQFNDDLINCTVSPALKNIILLIVNCLDYFAENCLWLFLESYVSFYCLSLDKYIIFTTVALNPLYFGEKVSWDTHTQLCSGINLRDTKGIICSVGIQTADVLFSSFFK